jgi:O-antigen/teichoic acid export membrane protein
MTFASPLVRNIGATGISQVVNLATQLALVPVLARYWGLETYGVWLVLFALPYYLTAADLGLAVAAGNDMTAAVAQGRRDEAVHTFQTMQAAILVLCLAFFAAAALLAVGPLYSLLDFAQEAAEGHAVAVLLLLVAYGLLAQQISVVHAGMRSVGAYARSTNFLSAVYLAEAGGAAGVAISGGTILHAAAVYLSGHVLCALGLRLLLHRQAPWLRTFPLRPSWAELRRLAPPALAMVCLPLSYALSIHGPTLVLGAFAGTAVVPIFVAVRIATRAFVQVPMVVAYASMPIFTVATAQGDEARRRELVSLALVTSLCVLVPAAIGLVAFGQELIGLWTGGVIVPPRELITLLVVGMFMLGTWWPLAILIMSMNEHARFTYVFLALSALALALAAILARPLGVVGAGIAMALLDSVMLVWVLFQARRLGMIDLAILIAAPRTVLALIERYLDGRGIRWRRMG